jgi:hypothetical protein
MTDQQHPITPAPELVQQWREQMPVGFFDGYKYPEREKALCLVAARWGADQELEACCEYLARCAAWEPEDVQEMLDLRRPKPPSLKEQALLAIDTAVADGRLSPDVSNVVRRALEQLDD